MPLSEIYIQPALVVDASELSDLALASKAVWGYDAEFLEICREVLRVDPQAIVEQPCYVFAGDDGVIKGFYLLEKLGDDCDLDMLFVAPDSIGQGVGKSLMMHALKQASSLGCTRMIVTSDPQALPFYERLGGLQIGWEKSEVSDDRLLPQLEFLL